MWFSAISSSFQVWFPKCVLNSSEVLCSSGNCDGVDGGDAGDLGHGFLCFDSLIP